MLYSFIDFCDTRKGKKAKKIGANTRADTSSLGSLRKIKGNRATKERGNTFFIDLGLFIVSFKQCNIVPDLKFSMFFCLQKYK